MGHARALLSLENRRQQSEVGALVAKKKLSVRETEALVKRLTTHPQPATAENASRPDANIRKLESDLSEKLGQGTCSIPLPAGVSSSSAITRLMSLTAFSNTSTELRAAAMHGGSFGVRQASLLNPAAPSAALIRSCALLVLCAANCVAAHAEIVVDGRLDEADWTAALHCADWRRTAPFARDASLSKRSIAALDRDRSGGGVRHRAAACRATHQTAHAA